ncbi:unnamed protein product [Symbiodinium sp. CCMP2456]|nr:unnamed protein product [Symbiodinium sp. CCMP2456]
MAQVTRSEAWRPWPPGPPTTLTGPPQTLRAPCPPSTVRPRPPPPPGTVRPAPSRTIVSKTRASNPRQAGTTTMKWYAGREKHPSAGYTFDAQNLSEEERLEKQLQLEAECNGVESGGYVAAEALNEHPSALPGFDRRLWSADPFYAWRTQEELCDESVTPVPHLQRDNCRPGHQEAAQPSPDMIARPKELTQVQEPDSWLHWFQARKQPPPAPPQPRPSAPLPSSASMAPRWDKEKAPDCGKLATAMEPAQTPLLPEPSPAELRERLEPELVAAGLSWDEVDEHLWSELRSVGELRRAAAYPHTFPRRLAALCAPLGRRMAAAEVRSFLEPELAKHCISWQDFVGGAQPPLDDISPADLEGCPRQPHVLARRVAAALRPHEPVEAPQPSLSLADPQEAHYVASSLPPTEPAPLLDVGERDIDRQGPQELPDKAPANRSSSKEALPSEEAQRSKKEKRREKKDKKDKKGKGAILVLIELTGGIPYSRSSPCIVAAHSSSLGVLVKDFSHLDRIDLIGGNGRWRQIRAEEEFARRAVEEEKRLRAQQEEEEKRRQRKLALQAKRRRLQEEEERRRKEERERQHQETVRIEELKRIEEERERHRKEQEEKDWLARQPKPCQVCSGTGKCIQCVGIGHNPVLYLAANVNGKNTKGDYGRRLQGCDGCFGFKQNMMADLKKGTGRCPSCDGWGKIRPDIDLTSPTGRTKRNSVCAAPTGFFSVG